MATISDPARARRLLEAAIAQGTKPTLSTEQVIDLLTVAAVAGPDNTVVYTGRSLNTAAAVGWNWKAGLTTDQYDLGGGAGRTLDRSQWHTHCRAMAAGYSSGEMSVLGDTTSGGDTGGRAGRSGIGSISMTTDLAQGFPARPLG